MRVPLTYGLQSSALVDEVDVANAVRAIGSVPCKRRKAQLRGHPSKLDLAALN